MSDSCEQSNAQLTESVKRVARQFGAALVGVGNIERYDPIPPYHDQAPKGHDPRDFLPDARSVISVAMPILDGVMDSPARANEREMEIIPRHIRSAFMDAVYARTGHTVHDCMLEYIGQMVGQTLVMQGYQAVFFPTTGVHPRPHGWEEPDIWHDRDGRPGSPFKYTYGPFSHRHAFTRAGLGEFGYNNVVLSREFGPRQRINTIITDAPLVPDPLITEPICLREKCRRCLKACYMDAVRMRDDPATQAYRSVDSVDRDVIFIDTPARSYPDLCNGRKDDRDHWPTRGDCIRVCPIPVGRKRQLTNRLNSLIRGENAAGD